MILIISSKDDSSTNDVIDWIRRFKKPFIRISNESIVEFKQLHLEDNYTDFLLSIDNLELWLSEVKSVWYRRSMISLSIPKRELIEMCSGLKKEFFDHINTELFYIKDLLEKFLEDRMLNRRSDVGLNKLTTLRLAGKLGIKTPNTIVTTSKVHLLEFLSKNPDVITKNISPGVFIRHENYVLSGYTTVVNKEMIEELPDNFYPMLFQEQIHKSFEIRAFFINNELYCSAIFSQKDEQTRTDFRNYNFSKPNRTPPINLPKEFEAKIQKLMEILKLNSGSIDIIVDSKGELIFLEVNPIGQFAQVSKPCNYQLERIIAESLIENKHERTTI